ncbi:MAG TPA: YceI family protein [Catalimonadaceae bacterium]|jgi:polyisoprenoid-binding protein YceI|nr:YceI family protein [Catalimonadaceae bacterium]
MAKWTIDPTHSEVGFKVKHLMISTVSGKFTQFNGEIESSSDEDFSGSKISFSADVNSIDTGMEMRDNHLKSDDFFNAEKFPHLSFTSTSFEKTGSDKYLMKGHLTLRDVTLPVTLQVTYSGTMVDFYGNQKAGFEISGSINRQEFGLKWSATTEAGGIVVSDEVKLNLDIQVQKSA